ncbi:hypothetical protein WJX72_001090 [[Myrmecia] bisecta]|uniref:SHSP domain-containing protein n=1 Tax=[Myrmecia] bisecta TaxID=41462 RepID=A0AAW1QP49_9CHLO
MADMLRWWEKAGNPTTLEEFVRLWEKFEKAAADGTPADSASRPAPTSTAQEDNASSLSLPVDSEQTKDTYIYTADVPGLDRTDIKVRVNSDRQLTISGERKHPDRSPSPDNVKDYSDYTGQAKDSAAQRGQRFERRFGRFSRSLTLPRDADVKSISASVERGVLTLTVKKLEKDPDVTDIPIY